MDDLNEENTADIEDFALLSAPRAAAAADAIRPPLPLPLLLLLLLDFAPGKAELEPELELDFVRALGSCDSWDMTPGPATRVAIDPLAVRFVYAWLQVP